jgi:hypothetical protein
VAWPQPPAHPGQATPPFLAVARSAVALEDAVRIEDYTSAAILRDGIRDLDPAEQTVAAIMRAKQQLQAAVVAEDFQVRSPFRFRALARWRSRFGWAGHRALELPPGRAVLQDWRMAGRAILAAPAAGCPTSLPTPRGISVPRQERHAQLGVSNGEPRSGRVVCRRRPRVSGTAFGSSLRSGCGSGRPRVS